MDTVKQWLLSNMGIDETEFMGGVFLLSACLLICLVSFLKKRMPFAIGMLQRFLIGIALILGVNQILSMLHISLSVGLGPVSLLTCAFLGIPGVCLLYAILLL